MSGEQISLPPFNLNLTPFLPQFHLSLTSFLPLFYLSFTSASLGISSHGLETTVYRPLDSELVIITTVVFLLRPPNLLRHRPFFERRNVCDSQENGVHTRCAAIINHTAIVNSLHVVN